jgi:hypothetical protein
MRIGPMSDPDRLTNPELPCCSIAGCQNAAAVIIGGDYFCFDHAAEALEARRLASREPE